MQKRNTTLPTPIQAQSVNDMTGHIAKSTLEASTSNMSSEDALKVVLNSLDDSKAEETLPIDITGKSPLFDHIVVTTGRSHRHVNAIADHLLRDVKNAGLGRATIEGLPTCDWVLIDTGDVVVHIFRPEVRAFYNIEKMWRDQADDAISDL
ncbi:MAG: ribosome silencing factor [Rhizobiales bacterium]|nr:ribosome silencing factor [Hyphomicrobiales bacterium]